MNADENIPLMTWRARPDMSCERVSQAWLDFTGLTPEAARGNGWSRGVHPEDLARWLDTYVRAFDERRPFEIEYRLRRHDGDYRWVLERAAPLYSEKGGFLGYGGGCVDIEEHKRVQQGLARALQREISSLLDNAPTGDQLLAGVKVLVVEHDGAARDTLLRVLGVAGAEVRAVASNAEALETLGRWQPDVLLSAQGDSLIRALRSLPAERGSAMLTSGADAQLAKPVEPVALLATVARLAA